MERKLQLWVAALVLWLPAAAQQSRNATLLVQVSPEALVNPAQVTLNFMGTTTQTVTVSARVRATPGRAIRLTTTQAGSLPVTWTGSAAQATGGGRQAGCTNGSFAQGATQDLAANWQSSGTLTCTLTFTLDPSLPPGSYSTTLLFAAQ